MTNHRIESHLRSINIVKLCYVIVMSHPELITFNFPNKIIFWNFSMEKGCSYPRKNLCMYCVISAECWQMSFKTSQLTSCLIYLGWLTAMLVGAWQSNWKLRTFFCIIAYLSGSWNLVFKVHLRDKGFEQYLPHSKKIRRHLDSKFSILLY